MTIYYIDGQAPTNGDGSFESPFNVSPTIASNNTYLFASGRVLDGKGSTAITLNPSTINVTLGCYDFETGEQLLTGPKKAIIKTESQWVIRVGTNCHNTIIEMLDVIGSSGNIATCSGIYIGNSETLIANNCTVRYCIIHNVFSNDASTATGLSYRGNYFTAHNNIIYNIGTDGVYGVGNNLKFYNNYVYNVDMNPSYGLGDCIQAIGTATLGCSHAYIANNVLVNPKTNKQCIILQDTTRASIGGIIENNFCKMPPDTGISNVIFVETTGAVVRKNNISGGSYGIFVAGPDILIAHNVIQSTEQGIAQETGITGIKVINNTIKGNSNKGINTSTDTTAIIYNNLLINCAIGLTKHGDAVEDYNAFWGCETNKSNAGGTPVWGSNTFTENPFVSDKFFLFENSPLIHAGLYYTNSVDMLKNTVHNPPSIGAYEFVPERPEATVRGVR